MRVEAKLEELGLVLPAAPELTPIDSANKEPIPWV